MELKKQIFEASYTLSIERQKIKVGTFESISQAVLKWSTAMRSNNLPTNGSITLEKTWEFPNVFDCKDFQKLKKWPKGWKEW